MGGAGWKTLGRAAGRVASTRGARRRVRSAPVLQVDRAREQSAGVCVENEAGVANWEV
jgi:hypothetical protein